LVSSVSTNSREIKCYVCTSSSRLAAQHHRLSAICFHFLFFLSTPPMHNPHPPLLHHRSRARSPSQPCSSAIPSAPQAAGHHPFSYTFPCREIHHQYPPNTGPMRVCPEWPPCLQIRLKWRGGGRIRYIFRRRYGRRLDDGRVYSFGRRFRPSTRDALK
jgi:hypothetical protein